MDEKPPLHELTDRVPLVNWKQVGLQLKIAPSHLEAISKNEKLVDDQLLQMYKLWLDTTPTATRRQLIGVLNMSCIGLNTLAAEYERWVTSNSGALLSKPQDQGTSTGAAAMAEISHDVKWDIKQLNEVLRYLRNDHDFGNAQWRDLGLKLGITHNALDTIEADYSGANRRLQECLARWLKQGRATKSQLDQAVDEVKRELIKN